jgi:peptidoglycan pentaglycine glycine transferase (the first glycine)
VKCARLQPPCEKVGEKRLAGRTVCAWLSRQTEDVSWDNFLQETPLGQFQQSTIWARAKSVEGWKPLRVLLTLDGVTAGGFQLLWRSSFWGKIAYVSKGPVVLPNCSDIGYYALDLLKDLARRERLRALVMQPPDACRILPTIMASAGLELGTVAGVIDATWTVDVTGGFEAVTRRMRTEARKNARQALERGVTVREGRRQDLQMFFELMLSTCRRQKVSPNPSDARQLFALWDAAPQGCVRLTFADYESKPLAAILCIAFGKAVAFWKKGWTSTESHRHPNDLLMYEALQWASINGYQVADLMGFDRGMATRIMAGQPLSQQQTRTRYMSFLRFGGRPLLLTPARVYFPNPSVQLLYRFLFGRTLRQPESGRAFRSSGCEAGPARTR